MAASKSASGSASGSVPGSASASVPGSASASSPSSGPEPSSAAASGPRAPRRRRGSAGQTSCLVSSARSREAWVGRELSDHDARLGRPASSVRHNPKAIGEAPGAARQATVRPMPDQPAQQQPAVQKLRVRYAKRGRLRFTSHRDFSRALERAVRRAGLPIAYSSGFSPHPRISYANASSTGAASEAEYLEISLVETVDPDVVRAALDEALPAGLDIVDVVTASAGSLADRLEASRWEISLSAGHGRGRHGCRLGVPRLRGRRGRAHDQARAAPIRLSGGRRTDVRAR